MVTDKYKLVNPSKVVGAKGGKKPNPPYIAKDTVASLSVAKILYGLGEGEISGIVGGGQGILLEDTPLLDSNNSPNFEGITWDFRSGTLNQEYIKGFPDISNEVPVNVELKSSVDWIKAINKTELSAVRIRLAWNGLKQQNDKGDVNGYRIDYAIDVKTDSGAYREVIKTKIHDKVSGRYERTHRIDLPEASTGWQIRVRRLTPNSTSDLIVDKMYIEAYAEVVDIKLRYPNTALLGLQYDAKTFSRIAKIAVRARGKLINIPNNLNPTTGVYTGIWNGTFKLAYSNNPAWIFYDILTSERYGLGKRIDKTMVDKWSLYNLGVYCDGRISDGKGGLEPRYTCNVYLQTQEDAFKVLQQLGGIFRAITYWNGESVVLDADTPQDPVYTFSRANVLGGNFEYGGTRVRDRHTVAKVAFDNPDEGFKTEYEYIRDEAGIAKFGINILDISAIGCTSRGQAQRAGLWALKSEQLETRTITFRTGLEGFIPQVGNIIEVSDDLLVGRATGGRIASVSSNLSSITLDRIVQTRAGDSLVINGKSGVSQRRTVSSVSGKVVTVSSAFSGIEEESVYAIDSPSLRTMKFRVMSVKPDEDYIFTISAIQHEPLKYKAVDTGADVKPTDITNLKPVAVDAPVGVTISSSYKVVQGQSVATMVIQWNQVKNAVAYAIEYRKDNGNWITIPNTGNISVEVEGVFAGQYVAKVRAVNSFEVYSRATLSADTTIVGKAGDTNALTSINATGVLFGMSLEWYFAVGSEDTALTEIEVSTSSTGANSSVLGKFGYPTNNTTITGLKGNLTFYYRGRIIDKLGNASAWSAWTSGTTEDSSEEVLDMIGGKVTQVHLSAPLNAKINTISTNTSQIANINSSLSGFTTQISTLTSNLSNTDINLNNLTIRVDNLVNNSGGGNTDLTALDTRVTNNTNNIANINTTLEELGATNLVSLKANVSNNNSRLNGLDTSFNTLNTKVVNISSKVDSNTTLISNLNSRLIDLEAGSSGGGTGDIPTDIDARFRKHSLLLEGLQAQIEDLYYERDALLNADVNIRLDILHLKRDNNLQ